MVGMSSLDSLGSFLVYTDKMRSKISDDYGEVVRQSAVF